GDPRGDHRGLVLTRMRASGCVIDSSAGRWGGVSLCDNARRGCLAGDRETSRKDGVVKRQDMITKQVVTTAPVDIALRTLDADSRQRVRSWFTHLANWGNDEFVRRRSHRLHPVPGVYLLKASSDLRIFFTIEEGTITILDIGTAR